MTKPQVAQGIKDKNAKRQNITPDRLKKTALKTSVLGLATAMGVMGLSQVACAELTWGSDSSYPQEGKYQPESYKPNSYKPNSYQPRRLQPSAVISMPSIITSKR